jgi:signal transduction histidine kinase/DNA-binding response OmpR family regulator
LRKIHISLYCRLINKSNEILFLRPPIKMTQPSVTFLELLTFYKITNIAHRFNSLTLLFFLSFNLLSYASLAAKGQAGFSLKSELSAAHKAEIKLCKASLDAASNSSETAKLYNDIAFIYMKASYYLDKSVFEKVNHYANKANLLTKEHSDELAFTEYLRSLIALGWSYKELGYYSEALKYFEQILELTAQVAYPSEYYNYRQSATTETALIFAAGENYEMAIRQYEALFEYANQNHIDKTKISSIVYMKLAGFYREMANTGQISLKNTVSDTKNLAIAFSLATKGLEVASLNKKPHRVALAYLELASIKLKLKEFKLVEAYLINAYNLLKNDERVSLLARYYEVRARLAGELGYTEEKMFYAERAFELLQNEVVTKWHISIGRLLAAAYREVGYFEKAIDILENTLVLEDILMNREEIKKSMLLKIQQKEKHLESERKKNELARAQSKSKNTIIIMIFLLFLVTAILAYSIFKDGQRKIRLTRIIGKKNQQLKELNLARSRLFANISHEFRTPLTLILGVVYQTLENEVHIDPEMRKNLETIKRNSFVLKSLTDDFQDLLKLEANKLMLKQQTFELSSVFENIVAKFDFLIAEKSINFNFNFKPLEGVYADIDKNKIDKVLNNLLSNAFKYTPYEGTVNFHVLLENNYLKVLLEDSGIGISEQDLPFIFDRYFQTNDLNKPLEGGSGVGLSLVKELVELMQGEIIIESRLGKGTMVSLRIPVTLNSFENFELANAPLQTAQTIYNNTVSVLIDSKEIDTAKEYTILLVEDNFEMQDYIISVLNDKYTILKAENGKVALEKLQRNNIDLIISDVMMPIMNGFTLLECVKKDSKTYNIPFIILTALSSSDQKLRALTTGVDDYLTKPFLPAELRARVHNLVTRYRKSKQVENEVPISSVWVENDGPETGAKEAVENRYDSEEDLELIRKITEIVEANLENDDFNLGSLTKQIHLGERQLRRKIKMITGLTPKQFQQEIKLKKAQQLLESKAYGSIKAVAMSTGFSNTTRFVNMFEKRFGRKPASYFN